MSLQSIFSDGTTVTGASRDAFALGVTLFLLAHPGEQLWSPELLANLQAAQDLWANGISVAEGMPELHAQLTTALQQAHARLTQSMCEGKISPFTFAVLRLCLSDTVVSHEMLVTWSEAQLASLGVDLYNMAMHDMAMANLG